MILMNNVIKVLSVQYLWYCVFAVGGYAAVAVMNRTGLRKQLAQTAAVYAGRMLAEMMHSRQTNRHYGVRRANPEIPAPPRVEEYNRWDEAQRTRRGRRPPQAQALLPPNPPHPLHPPPPPHNPHNSPINRHLTPPPSPASPLGRDEPTPHRQRRVQVRLPTPPDTPPRQQDDEVRQMQGSPPVEAASPTVIEVRGPTTTPTPPPTPSTAEGQADPPYIDIDALMADAHGQLVLRQSGAARHSFGLAVARGRGRMASREAGALERRSGRAILPARQEATIRNVDDIPIHPSARHSTTRGGRGRQR